MKTPNSIPEITFVIPCHNSGKFLRESIESIKTQTGDFSIKAIIISDDRSTDEDTLQILKDLAKEDNLTVIRSSHTPGPGGTRNAGVKLVTTEWLSFLDSDDILLPGAVQCRIDALRDFPDAEFIGADFQMWWPQKKQYDTPFFRSREIPKRILYRAFSDENAIRLRRPVKEFIKSAISHSGVTLVKLDVFNSVNGYEESIRFCEDHHFFIKLARKTDYIFVPKSIMLYRQHSSNMTNLPETGELAPEILYTAALHLLLKDNNFSNYTSDIKKRLSNLYQLNAAWYRYNGQFKESLIQAQKSIYYNKSSISAWNELFLDLIRYFTWWSR